MADNGRRVTRRVLSNGTRVLAQPTPGTGVFSLALSFEAGSRYETDDRAGLASLTAGLMLEGTRGMTGRELALRTDSAGASLDVLADYETCVVTLTGLTERLGESLAVLGEVARSPRLRKDELESARRKQLAEIAEDEDDPFTVARQAFLDLVYDEHPRHRPVNGTRDTVRMLTLSDVESFYSGFCTPASAVLAASGDLDADALVDNVDRVLGDWRAAGPVLPDPPLPLARGGKRSFLARDRRQTHVMVGGVGITRTDPRYPAVCLMDVILGDSAGFGSRLGRSLREAEGLAYVVESDMSSTAGLDPGVLWVYTATSPARAGRALEVLEEQLEEMRRRPPSLEELSSSKSYLRGRRLIESESCEERAARLVRSERYGLGSDYEDRYSGMLASVTPEYVLETSATLLDPDRLSTVVVGPASVWS